MMKNMPEFSFRNIGHIFNYILSGVMHRLIWPVTDFIFMPGAIILKKIFSYIEESEKKRFENNEFELITSKENILSKITIDDNSKRIILFINSIHIHRPFMTFDEHNKCLFINVEVGGRPGSLRKNYLPPEKAKEMLQDYVIEKIIFDYNDKWGLFPEPTFKSPHDCSSLMHVASKHTNCFLKLFRVK